MPKLKDTTVERIAKERGATRTGTTRSFIAAVRQAWELGGLDAAKQMRAHLGKLKAPSHTYTSATATEEIARLRASEWYRKGKPGVPGPLTKRGYSDPESRGIIYALEDLPSRAKVIELAKVTQRWIAKHPKAAEVMGGPHDTYLRRRFSGEDIVDRVERDTRDAVYNFVRYDVAKGATRARLEDGRRRVEGRIEFYDKTLRNIMRPDLYKKLDSDAKINALLDQLCAEKGDEGFVKNLLTVVHGVELGSRDYPCGGQSDRNIDVAKVRRARAKESQERAEREAQSRETQRADARDLLKVIATRKIEAQRKGDPITFKQLNNTYRKLFPKRYQKASVRYGDRRFRLYHWPGFQRQPGLGPAHQKSEAAVRGPRGYGFFTREMKAATEEKLLDALVRNLEKAAGQSLRDVEREVERSQAQPPKARAPKKETKTMATQAQSDQWRIKYKVPGKKGIFVQPEVLTAIRKMSDQGRYRILRFDFTQTDKGFTSLDVMLLSEDGQYAFWNEYNDKGDKKLRARGMRSTGLDRLSEAAIRSNFLRLEKDPRDQRRGDAYYDFTSPKPITDQGKLVANLFNLMKATGPMHFANARKYASRGDKNFIFYESGVKVGKGDIVPTGPVPISEIGAATPSAPKPKPAAKPRKAGGKRRKLRLVSEISEIRPGTFRADFETPAGAVHPVTLHPTADPNYWTVTSGTYDFAIYEKDEIRELFKKATNAAKKKAKPAAKPKRTKKMTYAAARTTLTEAARRNGFEVKVGVRTYLTAPNGAFRVILKKQAVYTQDMPKSGKWGDAKEHSTLEDMRDMAVVADAMFKVWREQSEKVAQRKGFTSSERKENKAKAEGEGAADLPPLNLFYSRSSGILLDGDTKPVKDGIKAVKSPRRFRYSKFLPSPYTWYVPNTRDKHVPRDVVDVLAKALVEKTGREVKVEYLAMDTGKAEPKVERETVDVVYSHDPKEAVAVAGRDVIVNFTLRGDSKYPEVKLRKDFRAPMSSQALIQWGVGFGQHQLVTDRSLKAREEFYGLLRELAKGLKVGVSPAAIAREVKQKLGDDGKSRADRQREADVLERKIKSDRERREEREALRKPTRERKAAARERRAAQKRSIGLDCKDLPDLFGGAVKDDVVNEIPLGDDVPFSEAGPQAIRIMYAMVYRAMQALAEAERGQIRDGKKRRAETKKRLKQVEKLGEAFSTAALTSRSGVGYFTTNGQLVFENPFHAKGLIEPVEVKRVKAMLNYVLKSVSVWSTGETAKAMYDCARDELTGKYRKRLATYAQHEKQVKAIKQSDLFAKPMKSKVEKQREYNALRVGTKALSDALEARGFNVSAVYPRPKKGYTGYDVPEPTIVLSSESNTSDVQLGVFYPHTLAGLGGAMLRGQSTPYTTYLTQVDDELRGKTFETNAKTVDDVVDLFMRAIKGSRQWLNLDAKVGGSTKPKPKAAPKKVVTKAQLAKARSLGEAALRRARKSGTSIAPAQDPKVLAMLKGFEVGDPRTARILDAWSEGYNDENRKLAHKELREQGLGDIVDVVEGKKTGAKKTSAKKPKPKKKAPSKKAAAKAKRAAKTKEANAQAVYDYLRRTPATDVQLAKAFGISKSMAAKLRRESKSKIMRVGVRACHTIYAATDAVRGSNAAKAVNKKEACAMPKKGGTRKAKTGKTIKKGGSRPRRVVMVNGTAYEM